MARTIVQALRGRGESDAAYLIEQMRAALEAWLEADELSRTTFAANMRSRAIDKTRAALLSASQPTR